MAEVGVGKRVPPLNLGVLVDGMIQPRSLEMLLQGRRAVIIGVPGAFTPVCTEHHVPGLINSAERLKASGVGLLVCVTPNDPWTTDAWARLVDPERKLLFLSDGNLALAAALGTTIRDTDNFLGQRSRRYLLQTRDAVIERLNVETSPLALTCTRAQDVILD
jgi:2-Cys peroxiredoxin 5